MVRVILGKRAELGKYWRLGLPVPQALAPGTSPRGARGGGYPVSAVMGRRGGSARGGGAPRARFLGGVPFFLLLCLLNNIE